MKPCTLYSPILPSSLCYKVKLTFPLPFCVTFSTAHSRYMGSLRITSVSMHTNTYYSGRFIFFIFIVLQPLKQDIHSSFLNLHYQLQLYLF